MTITKDEIAKNVERYREISDELMRLYWQREEAQSIAHHSRLEEMKALQSGMRVEPIAYIYDEAVNAIDRRMIDLQKLMPNREFVERFGWQLHEYFKEKYPLNVATKIVDMGRMYNGYTAFNYPIPTVVHISLYTKAAPPPTQVAVNMGRANIERWAQDALSRVVSLAYAPEINTVYVFE